MPVFRRLPRLLHWTLLTAKWLSTGARWTMCDREFSGDFLGTFLSCHSPRLWCSGQASATEVQQSVFKDSGRQYISQPKCGRGCRFNFHTLLFLLNGSINRQTYVKTCMMWFICALILLNDSILAFRTSSCFCLKGYLALQCFRSLPSLVCVIINGEVLLQAQPSVDCLLS